MLIYDEDSASPGTRESPRLSGFAMVAFCVVKTIYLICENAPAGSNISVSQFGGQNWIHMRKAELA